ncbi:MAG: response regulator transcription factor [Candidatus Gastranaerophilaceae bacterium]
MTQSSSTAQKTISVIIVEDFKLTRVGLRCALNANEDIDVVAEAEDALEGLKLIERHKPDVILMDLGLPGMNGIEAMIKCKEMMFESKIIALTSRQIRRVIAALSSGAGAYCLKILIRKNLPML